MGINIDYFLDYMQEYELEAVINAYQTINKTSWEQTRTIAYTTAQCNSTKRIRPTDILKFTWDEETEQLLNNDWDELKGIREHFKYINNGNNRTESNAGVI